MESKHGLLPEPLPIRDYSFDVCCKASSNDELPEEYELPQELLPPIYNQENTLKCVAFSMCECAESERLKSGNDTRLSPSYNYGRNECRSGHTGGGLYASTAMKGSVKIGFVPFIYFPFKDDVPNIIYLAKERSDLLKIGEKIKPTGFVSPWHSSADKRWESIKKAIYTYQSPVLIISHNYFGESHAVMAYGWTTTNGEKKGKFLKFQNSWGENWGQNGRSTISIGQVDGAYMFTWKDVKLPFDDVKESDWFFNEVKNAYLAGYVQGTSATTFFPDASIIRGDIAVMVDRYLTKIEESINIFAKAKRQAGDQMKDVAFEKAGANVFIDVSPNDYYEVAIRRTYANGIMNGINSAEFCPWKGVTRAEAAAIAVRMIETTAKKLNITVPVIKTYSGFRDVSSDKWYYEYVKKAYTYDLMQGIGGNEFAPDAELTRAEWTTIGNRTLRETDHLLRRLI